MFTWQIPLQVAHTCKLISVYRWHSLLAGRPVVRGLKSASLADDKVHIPMPGGSEITQCRHCSKHSYL